MILQLFLQSQFCNLISNFEFIKYSFETFFNLINIEQIYYLWKIDCKISTFFTCAFLRVNK